MIICNVLFYLPTITAVLIIRYSQLDFLTKLRLFNFFLYFNVLYCIFMPVFTVTKLRDRLVKLTSNRVDPVVELEMEEIEVYSNINLNEDQQCHFRALAKAWP